MNTTSYVAGFMFDLVTKEVALIRKNKPAWQAGKLNAIGGKIEEGETPAAAMVREFEEETSYETRQEDWKHFAALIGPDWNVQFFVAFGSLALLESPEEEQIEIHDLDIIPQRRDVVGNVPWLVVLALDASKNSGPTFVTANYSAR